MTDLLSSIADGNVMNEVLKVAASKRAIAEEADDEQEYEPDHAEDDEDGGLSDGEGQASLGALDEASEAPGGVAELEAAAEQPEANQSEEEALKTWPNSEQDV